MSDNGSDLPLGSRTEKIRPHPTNVRLGPSDNGDIHLSHMNCFMVVLRRIYIEFSPRDLERKLRDCHPLLELARSVIDDRNGSKRQVFHDDEALSRLSWPDVLNPDSALPYLQLSESDAVLEHLWSLKSMLLWLWIKRAERRNDVEEGDDEEWGPWVPQFEAEGPPLVMDRLEVAANSLIKFNPAKEKDGTTLTHVVHRMFGIHIFETFKMWLAHHRSVCIRVHFTPGDKHIWNYSDLSRLEAPGYLNEYGRDKTASAPWDFRLGAVVRIGNQGEPSFVRLYNSNHAPIHVRPEHSASLEASYLNSEWRLGEPGHEYMLYYIACSFGCPSAPREEIPVVRPLGADADQDYADMRAAIDAAVTAPQPTPSESSAPPADQRASAAAEAIRVDNRHPYTEAHSAAEGTGRVDDRHPYTEAHSAAEAAVRVDNRHLYTGA